MRGHSGNCLKNKNKAIQSKNVKGKKKSKLSLKDRKQKYEKVSYKAEVKKTSVINGEKIKKQALHLKEVVEEGIMVLQSGKKGFCRSK